MDLHARLGVKSFVSMRRKANVIHEERYDCGFRRTEGVKVQYVSR